MKMITDNIRPFPFVYNIEEIGIYISEEVMNQISDIILRIPWSFKTPILEVLDN